MGNTRYDWIDIAKGILICCMLYGHVLVYGPMDGLSDYVMKGISCTIGLYNAFFMQTFFVVTGFCSSFSAKFTQYLWKNVKTLLIPSLILMLFSEYYKLIFFEHLFNLSPFKNCVTWLIVGVPWFVWAMFWARLMYWPIARLNNRSKITICSIVYIVGLSFKSFGVSNYMCHQHAMMMIPYLFIGEWCRYNRSVWERWLRPIAIVGGISIILQNVISHLGIATLPTHDFAISISYGNFLVHILNAVMGTAFVFWVSRCISKASFLDCWIGGGLRVLGTGTLIVYLWNGIVYRTITRALMFAYAPTNLPLSALFHLVTLVLCYVTFYFVVKVIYGKDEFSWIVGKW